MDDSFIQLKGYDELRKLLDPKIVDKAAYRALNKALSKGRTEVSKQIRKKWNIKKKDLDKKLTIKKANGTHLSGSFMAKSRPISMTYFGAEQFRPYDIVNKKRRDYSVTRGGAKMLGVKQAKGKSGVYFKSLRQGPKTHKPNAFLATTDSGHIGVFERMGKKRLKVREFNTITVASMFGQKEVYEPSLKKIEETMDSEFPRLIDVLFSK